MARDHLLAIDQGTTSTRAVVYDPGSSPSARGRSRSRRPTRTRAGSSTTRRHLVDSAGPMVVAAMAEADDQPRTRSRRSA